MYRDFGVNPVNLTKPSAVRYYPITGTSASLCVDRPRYRPGFHPLSFANATTPAALRRTIDVIPHIVVETDRPGTTRCLMLT